MLGVTKCVGKQGLIWRLTVFCAASFAGISSLTADKVFQAGKVASRNPQRFYVPVHFKAEQLKNSDMCVCVNVCTYSTCTYLSHCVNAHMYVCLGVCGWVCVCVCATDV